MAGNANSGERGWVYLTFHWRNQFQILDAKASRRTAKLGDPRQKQKKEAGSLVFVEFVRRVDARVAADSPTVCQTTFQKLIQSMKVQDFLGFLQPDPLLQVQIDKTKIGRTTFSGLESSFSASEVVEAFSFNSMASFSGVSAFS